MQRLYRIAGIVCFCATVMCVRASAEEPITLIGTIVNWRYPEAEIGESEMSDAATIDANGDRTVPSTLLKTTMTTPDSVDQVMAFYRELLNPEAANRSKLGVEPDAGRSVLFGDESDGRPFAFQTITVNSAGKSTTIVVTRGPDESKTHITWKQYIVHQTGE